MKQLLFSLLLFALGCSGGEISLEGNAGAGLKDIEVTMTFTVAKSTANTDTTVVATKADVVADAVQDLWIGQYNKNGELLICHYLNNISGNGNSITLQLKEAAGCSIYFVANAGDLGKIPNFATYQLAYNSEAGGLSTSEGIPVSGNMPLYGSLTNQTVSVSYTPTVELSRLLGKVKLSLTLGVGFDFTVTNVSLCSVPAAIQCKEPEGQASDITYQTFSKTLVTAEASGSPAVYEWYIPENKAGTIASNEEGYADDERHKCGGNSVPNATYIEIVGEAKVEGITYSGVQFRLYPGENVNDYSIKRNKLYDVSLNLTGIDFSDPRVLWTILDMTPLFLGVQANETGSVQITARPGQEWSFTVPDWLSAKIGEDVFASGSTLSHTGSVVVDFTTTSFNLYKEDRKLESMFGDKLSVKQSGSTLSVSGDGNFGVGTSSIMLTIDATNGLPWSITTTDETNRFTLTPTSGVGSSPLTVGLTDVTSREDLFSAPYLVTVDGTSPTRSESFLITQGVVWDGNKLYVEKADISTSGITQGSGFSFGSVLDKSYAIAIEIDNEDMPQDVNVHNYTTANSNCAKKYTSGDWRLPTLFELVAMFHHREALPVLNNINKGTSDKSGYLSSSRHSYSRGAITSLCFLGKRADYWDLGMGSNPKLPYRCVRTIDPPK